MASHVQAHAQRLHADYAGPILGKYYLLIIIDSFSRWPEVFITESATGAFTERAFRSLFAREGIAQVLVTDNGTHFTDTNFNNWLHDLNVHHMYTAPRHPKSNGLAENFVKTIKSAISAVEIHDIIDLERAIHAFLFQYRNAVQKMTNQRPSVLFRQEILRHPIIRDANILFRRGNDLRFANGIVVQNLGNKMVKILDIYISRMTLFIVVTWSRFITFLMLKKLFEH